MTYARSRSRIGARPRTMRYARNNRDTGALSNPLLQLPLYAGFWGDDPAWTDNPGVGQAVSSWRNGGTLAASGAYTDPTLGLVLPGVAGNYASVPDEAALDITGDITLVARVALADWTPAASQSIITKWNSSGNQRSFALYVLSSGLLTFQWSADGAATLSATSSVVAPFANGDTGWIAVTLDVNNGAGGRTAKFWTSVDGITWTQLGIETTTAGVTAIFNSTTQVDIGAVTNGTLLPTTGNISVARIYSGSGFTTAGPTGALVVDVDFRRTTVGAFTASTGQTVTVASTFNANQSTAGSRPTLTTSALLGGRRVVDFDGTDDRLGITTGVSLAQPFEVWAIAVWDSLAIASSLVGLQSGSNARRIGTGATGPVWVGNMGNAFTGGTPAVNTPYVVRSINNGASSSIVINGASVAVGNVGAGSVDQVILGAGRTAPSTYDFPLDGKIAFLGILPAASITATHRRQFALWAANFYSVPGFAAAA